MLIPIVLNGCPYWGSGVNSSVCFGSFVRSCIQWVFTLGSLLVQLSSGCFSLGDKDTSGIWGKSLLYIHIWNREITGSGGLALNLENFLIHEVARLWPSLMPLWLGLIVKTFLKSAYLIIILAHLGFFLSKTYVRFDSCIDTLWVFESEEFSNLSPKP